MSECFLPPRMFFCDDAHYASFLALLDGEARLQWALSRDGEARAEFALWSRRSLTKSREYILESKVSPSWRGRPEYSPETIYRRSSFLFTQSKAVLASAGDFRLARAPCLLYMEVNLAD